MQNILVTGGAGFIGSHLVDLLLAQDKQVIVLDLLTYAGNLDNLIEAKIFSTFKFVHGDICDPALVANILHDYNIDTVFHLAAESHVDNSIADPGRFITTNINGTYNMLHTCLQYWEAKDKPTNFRFIHVSTDEVFGHLAVNAPPFNEETPYKPNSPYSASKAASDLLVRAWWQTYKFPAIITNCSNNYGPRQHAEKLIPTVVRTALAGQNIPVYGTGQNIRDWLYVQDHCNGLILAAERGLVGASYCFGGNNELRNIDMVHMICDILDTINPKTHSYKDNITYVADRKGHDFRYAIDAIKAHMELGWQPSANFQASFGKTVQYYSAYLQALRHNLEIERE